MYCEINFFPRQAEQNANKNETKLMNIVCNDDICCFVIKIAYIMEF